MGILSPFGDLANPFEDDGSAFIRGLLKYGFNTASPQQFAPQQPQMQMPPGMSPVANPNAPLPPARPNGLLTGPGGAPPNQDAPSSPMQLGPQSQKSYPMEEVENEDAPQPPPRPKDLTAGGVGQQTSVQSTVPQAQSPSDQQGLAAMLSRLGTTVGGIYGNGGPGDPMIALGTGLMSKRRFGEGLQAGLDNMQRQSLIQSQTAQANQKIAQQQAQLQSRIQTIKSKFPNMPDSHAASIAATDALYTPWAKQNLEGMQDGNYATFQGKDGKTYYFDKSDPDSGAKVLDGQSSGGYTLADGRPATQAKAGDIVFGPDGKPVVLSSAGNSTTVNMPPSEKASEQAFGQAQGKHWGDVLSAGDNAYKTIQNLDMLREAYRAGGNNIRSGPFATAILKGKQALGDMGIDVGGVPESEMVNKLGFELATQLTKAISNRPAQSEFLRALENVPGLSMSNAGAGFMIDILKQKALHDAQLGQLIADPENRKNWSDVQKNFYESHPLVSPYTGRPLGAADAATLQRQIAAEGPQQPQPNAPEPASDTIARARQAIANGGDRKAIINRLLQNGINPAGL